MPSWFKKHFSCFRREQSDLAVISKKRSTNSKRQSSKFQQEHQNQYDSTSLADVDDNKNTIKSISSSLSPDSIDEKFRNIHEIPISSPSSKEEKEIDYNNDGDDGDTSHEDDSTTKNVGYIKIYTNSNSRRKSSGTTTSSIYPPRRPILTSSSSSIRRKSPRRKSPNRRKNNTETFSKKKSANIGNNLNSRNSSGASGGDSGNSNIHSNKNCDGNKQISEKRKQLKLLIQQNRNNSNYEKNLNANQFLNNKSANNINNFGDNNYNNDIEDDDDYDDSEKNDGRVHSAVISKINNDARSITVEWYERGETKGKEVELDAILALNPNLVKQQDQGFHIEEDEIENRNSNNGMDGSFLSRLQNAKCNEPEAKKVATAPNNLARLIQHSSLDDYPSGNEDDKNNPTHGAIRVMNRLNNTQNGHRTNRTTLSSANGSHMENIPPSNQPPQPTGLAKSRSTTNASKMSITGSQASQIAQPRRSYVVKEVERLKENREKRRARQAELKEEKNALMNMDPGNPNWETAAMIRDFQSTLEFRPLVDGQPVEDHQITVCVRKRPVSRKEQMRKEIDVISVPSKDTLMVHEPKTKVDLTKFLENHKFRFDYAFDDTCSNEIVYKYTAKPLVRTIFEGGMATCFAYGQTGSGKTHTMGGEFNGKIQDCKNGIYAMAAKDVFAYLNSSRYNHLNLVVSASFFEIYSGKVFDLLSDKQKLRVLEDGKQQVQVVGLTEKVVENVEEVLKLIQHGNTARTSGQTSANQNSSRSHAVFQIVLRPPGSTKIHGKFSFIDLAGNERGADTSSSNRQTRMEGAEINKSLLALKECIRALGKQHAHLPFRVSKLTQVLRDSFIGEKSKTCMIAMISPGLSSCEHTLNTLRYADRVKELVYKDAPERNDDMMEQMDDEDIKNGELNENELAHLRSLNEQDMTDELYNQHAAISELQQTEEMVVDQHKALNDFLLKFVAESRDLYNLTNYVDYDQDAYCKHGEDMFTRLVEAASQVRDSMAEFRSKLAQEEMLSCTIKPTSRH
ncbi:kinesin-like protein Klp10A isoform X2 [Condylostylus longicornis]|uniref:kinesin-like protein Klp10A isoform X2 n=1 Tax=Condylostylus longicornis TaxID=2530218 RepID=UPI00244E1553|nr:kinesin-like protein Klp10A isoform X2 [Condylostylus longicornis]